MNCLKEPLINHHFVILNISEESFATMQTTAY